MSIFGLGKTEESKKVSSHNSQEEGKLAVEIDNSQQYAEGGKRTEIERDWEDEYKIYQGGGKQWDTSKGIRTPKGKKRNFNSEDNIVFSTIRNMVAPFSAPPTTDISGVEQGDNEAAETINDLVASALYRNKFPEQWEKMVLQMTNYGPIIGYVPWDQHWIGGSGPDRWVGEVRTLFVKKEEFFPDPAIIDLEERLQDCSYINLKQRKKLQWFKDTWPEKGQYVLEDTLDIPKGQEDEGQDPQQATLITHFHKGAPYFVSDFWKKRFLEKAQEAEQVSQLPYYAKDLRDMAAGTLKGVHCAYKAGTILLDYVPYIYEDGLYPFVYKVLYSDEKQPWGMGEIRNIVIPQILHNKADEIELGAMLGQGLGGYIYEKGAVSATQKEEFMDSLAKPNTMNEVTDVNRIKPKPTIQVPANISMYKDNKKIMIDTITGNTAVMQGQSLGANTPYATYAELGARADARMRHKAKVLERFMVEFVEMIERRILQNYTEGRKYRILGDRQVAKVQSEAYKTLQQIASMPQGTPPEEQLQALVNLLEFVKQQAQMPKTATYSRKLLVRTWDRETITETDESGQPVKQTLKEEFFPEFDNRVKVMDERPTDRNYWTNLATATLGKALGVKNFWKIIDEGKLPRIEDILAELEDMKTSQDKAPTEAMAFKDMPPGGKIQMAAHAGIRLTPEEVAQQAEAEKQAGLEKIAMQNQSMEKQVVMSAMAKAGAK
jgi:hypothetical protein